MDKAIRRYNMARNCLLAVVIFGAINQLLALIGQNMYFLFSDYAAYIAALYFRGAYEETGVPMYLAYGAIISAFIILTFLLCWALSKKRSGWMIAGFVLLIMDTLVVLYFAFTVFGVGECLLDIIFHVIMIVEVALGVAAAKDALTDPESAEPWDRAPTVQVIAEYPVHRENTQPLGAPAEKARVLVEADYGGHHIQALRSRGLTELVIDGRVYGRKEGIIEVAYTISAMLDGHEIATTITANSHQQILADGEIIADKLRIF